MKGLGIPFGHIVSIHNIGMALSDDSDTYLPLQSVPAEIVGNLPAEEHGRATEFDGCLISQT
jgi:hypothetical protein